LLDEPLASLDRKLRKEMQLELRRIQKKVKTTFLYVTHDQKVALSLSDRIGVMESGKVVQIGTPEEIYEKPKTSFVANFMGASNVIYGKITDVQNGKIEIVTDDGHIVFTLERDDVPNEDIVGIAINPNALEITDQPPKTKFANTLFGKVNEIFYQGDFAEITVILDKSNQMITIHQNITAGEHLAACPGQDVHIHWDERHSISLVK
jgi:spermidine/putrescine transport system ATP-binding protein